MLRDRLVRALRRALWSVPTGDLTASPKRPEGPQPYSGDTPGPNHKSHIGRTFLAAQVCSGAPPFLIDTRSVGDWRRRRLPGARSFPGGAAVDHPDLLPPQDDPVVVYDSTGHEHAEDVAARLRDAGWLRARRLVGGIEEWVAHDEVTERGAPQEPESS